MKQAGDVTNLGETTKVVVQLERGDNDGHDVDTRAHITYHDDEGNEVGYETLFVEIPAHGMREAIGHADSRLKNVGLTVDWDEAAEENEEPRDFYERNEFPVVKSSS